MNFARVKWYGLEVGPLIGTIAAALALAMGLSSPASAQISMNRPGITGIPQQPKKPAATAAPHPTTLTADEQKRLTAIIKHMKPKERRKLSQALQKMTPQQRQQLLASVKQQLAQQRTAALAKKASR